MTTRRDLLKAGAALGLGALLPARADDAAAGWQLGCYTRPWDQYEYRVALDAIAEAGFPYIGIMVAKGKSWVIITTETTPEEAAQVGEEVRKRGLKALSVYGGLPALADVEPAVKNLRLLIDHCVAVGSPNLLLGGTTDPKLVDPYYKAVAECCDYAKEKGVGLSIKPHGGQNSTGPQCRALIERVGHPSFRLTYDPGNIYYYSDGRLDPVDDAATVDGLVAGMCVKDFRDPKEVLVTPGTGRVNFKAVLARLEQGGFTKGPLIVECLDKGDAEHTTAEAKKALRFLKELTAKAP
jgi:sugar phosphate isomerase/epimerase